MIPDRKRTFEQRLKSALAKSRKDFVRREREQKFAQAQEDRMWTDLDKYVIRKQQRKQEREKEREERLVKKRDLEERLQNEIKVIEFEADHSKAALQLKREAAGNTYHSNSNII